MKGLFETKEERATISRRLRAGRAVLLFVLLFGVMAEARMLRGTSADAKHPSAFAASYWRSGQWRKDAGTYVTYVEYLLFPKSGAGARLDMELDD